MQFFFCFLNCVALGNLANARLEFNSIKKQQTYPAWKRFEKSTVTTESVLTISDGVTETTTSVFTVDDETICNYGCDSGWIPYQENCYTMISKATVQSSAEADCVDRDSNLLSLESADEEKAVRNLVISAPLFATNLTLYLESGRKIWIGLSKTQNGAWKWSDGSDVLHTNLPTGDSTSDEACVVMNNTNWQPVDCSSMGDSFICKKMANLK